MLWSGGTLTERLTVLERDLATLPDLRLLVLYNVALMFDGEEISRKDVSGFLTALTRMARRLKIDIILIHHASKSQDGTSLRMASGSTAWVAQSRVAAEVRKATETDGSRLAVRKINNGREWESDLRWTDDGTLVLVTGVAAAPVARQRSSLPVLRQWPVRGGGPVLRKTAPVMPPDYSPACGTKLWKRPWSLCSRSAPSGSVTCGIAHSASGARTLSPCQRAGT